MKTPVNIRRRRLTLAMSASLAAPVRAAPLGAARPNILFIAVDDLDYGIYRFMGKLRRLVREPGLELGSHFINLTLCAPSRATMLRGQFAHNTRNTDNLMPWGGFEKFFKDGLESSTFATWLQSAGYRTGLVGKYLNNYPSVDSGANYVPPGWDTWFSPNGGGSYGQYWYSVNDDGSTRHFGGAPQDHFQNVLLRRAQAFLRSAAADPPARPFLLWVAPYLPHKPYRAPVPYLELFPGLRAPRPPSFNEADVSDKPAWLRALPRLDAAAIRQVEETYRKRRQCAAALDDMVEGLVSTLAETGQLDDTYVLFSSDNGFFHGEHRIPEDKRRAYEEAIRVPLVIRGPGIPAGRTVYRLTGNVDFAPTFAELAGITPPAFVDGRSLVPLFSGMPPWRWRRAYLLESQPAEATDAERAYAGLRTNSRQTFVLYDNGDAEYYDMRTDPWQLQNRYADMPEALKGSLTARLRALQGSGGAALRRAEEQVFGGQ
ncbi:sulfatase family protein [Azohydromonas caseinilytica]|uniref:Sulfatase n=1 Tax=Azohydromonas caseinilytica TaxID=2728836 RepID=A0A848FIM3_9BURK|nr:sulfatase [Azohydromonas caseinilytica]NML18745.1 sulfatase [Azohydromonas caseinilytica]